MANIDPHDDVIVKSKYLRNFANWRTARFIAITVVLGAIGSGMWEWILKPALSGTSETILNIATLGISAFKNSLYQDVAMGFREEPSLRLYTVFLSLLPACILGFMAGFFSARKTGNGSGSIYERVVFWSIRPVLVIVTFLLVFSIFQVAQVAYINRAITHFEQISTIAAPHLSEQQRLTFRSRFAQISDQGDYAKLINEIYAVCRTNNLRIPTFVVW